MRRFIFGVDRKEDMAKNLCSRWTPELIAQFCKDYPNTSWEVLEAKYPFTKSSMLTKASQLGIRRLTGRPTRYNSADDSVITAMFNDGLSDNEIASKLGRSVLGIRARRERIGHFAKHRWSSREDEVLREWYSKIPAADVAKMLHGRSRNAVVAHAKILGLQGFRDYHEYTQEEELYIKENYLCMSDEDIGKQLGHARASIKNRRNKLGLHRPTEKTKYDDAVSYFRKYNLDWKNESMKTCGYRCVVTGERFDDIHHLFSLNTIVINACKSADIDLQSFDINEASDEDRKNFIEAVKREQGKYPLGVCLSKEVHVEFHNIYGYGNNTPEQFYEFINSQYPGCMNLH